MKSKSNAERFLLGFSREDRKLPTSVSICPNQGDRTVGFYGVTRKARRSRASCPSSRARISTA
jgi:hypothetical protein